MKKRFKNNFAVSCTNIHLMKAFIKEAIDAGWQWQEGITEKNGKYKLLYFGAKTGKYDDLKSGHFWYCDSATECKVFNLPSQWDEALQFMKEELVEKETYSLGDRFVCTYGIFKNTEYILSRVGDNTICLINLTDGNMWHKPVKVKNLSNITEEDFQNVTTHYHRDHFQKINKNKGE